MQNQERETPKDPARAGTYGARRERERESKSHSQKITKTVILAIIFIAGLFLLSQYSEKIWAAVVFTDDTQAEFESGVYSHNETQWDATNSWLELTATGLTNGSGDYTSDIKDAGVSTTWTTISWIPERPTGKELPNSGNSETDYNSGNANMSNNILLMHMNDNAASTAVVDSSGSGNNGTFNDATGDPNTSAHSTTTAKFNTALEFDGTDDLINLGDVLDMTTNDFTISAWIKTSDNEGPIVWKYENDFDNGYYFIIVNGVTQLRLRNIGDNVYSTGSILVNDSVWHHVVAVADRDNIGELYVDGVYDTGSDNISALDGISLSHGYDFTIGDHVMTGMSSPFNGTIDEVAMWNRALSATEIADIYKRGALKFKTQVRSCNDAACSGEILIGPDGTASTYYEWGTTNSVSAPSFSLTNVSDNRYFQYKTYFETATSTYSPELRSLVISDTTYTYYYMRADGTAANKAVATSCSSASTAMSVATHNAGTFSGGDTIILCDDGGDYTAQITIPYSGSSSSNLITYQAETGGSPVIDLNNLADYCFRGTDKEFISISGITCQEAEESGFRFDNTSAKDTITITDIICDNVQQNCIWIEGSSGNLFSNITISNSTFNRWSQEDPYGGANTVNGRAGIFIKYADTILIDNNTIDIGATCSSRSGSSCGDAIWSIEVTNQIIEYNEIKTEADDEIGGGGHGINIFCDGAVACTGTGNITRYNYIHDVTDDCFWMDNQTDNPLYYGNLCINTADDCTDIRGTFDGVVTGTGKVFNNTCINFASTGIQTINKTAVTYKNNIYVADVDACDTGDNTISYPCFAVFEDAANNGYTTMAESTFNNNIYYNSGSNGNNVEAFVAQDLDAGTTVYMNPDGGNTMMKRGTLAQWQADNSAPDANSTTTNPLLTNLTTDFTLQATSPAIDAGIDINLSTDYAGNSRYDMPSIANTGSAGSYTYDYVDIGAYEYVTPPDTTLQCTTHPSESTWYTDVSTVSISFASPYDTLAKATTTDFRYLVNQTQSPASTTIQTATLLDDAITFDPASSITSDGTWYIHALGQNESNTSTYSANYDTYTINYDATNPTVSLSSPAGGFSTTESQPTMSWSGSDSASGIAKYQLYIDGALDTDNISGASAAPSSALSCGSHTWYVKAVDNAGNSTNSSTFNLTRSCGGGIPIQLLQQINDARRAKQNADAGKEESKPINEEPEKEEAEEVESKIHSSIIEEYRVEAAAIFKADVDSIVSTVNKERDIDLEIDVINGYLTEIGAVAESREEAAGAYWQLMIVNFITYGTPSTLILGAGERAGAVNSYKSAFNKLPKTENEWLDAIKIANGRWPNERNEEAEERARTNFEIVYLRQPDRSDPHDDAAITVMAYGLRPSNRNMDSEKAAIKIFRDIYGYNPEKATAWDVVRAIAYSGATR